MPLVDYSRLRDEVTIVQVLELLNYDFSNRIADTLRGPCPIHGSTSGMSRSFSVDLCRNLFRCFKCEAGGNQLDLWAEANGLPLYQAALDLCDKLGFEPPLSV